MIRINLLPFRVARKRENVRRQVTVYALVVMFSLVLGGYYFLQLSSSLSAKKAEEERIKAELVTYQKTLNKIKALEKAIKEIKIKLNVIKKLEEGKIGPVLLLDEISMAVPKGKLWLTTLKEGGGNLSLAGTAMDNETVALFMNNLEGSEHIISVDLKNVKLRRLPQFRLNVSDFSLQCKISYAGKEKAVEEKKTAKK